MPETLTPGDGQDVFTRFKQAREKRDPDLMVVLFAADAEYRPDPFEPPMAGSNELRAHWNKVAMEQTHVAFDAQRVWVAGRTVLGSWHAAYTRQESGERVRLRGFTSMEIDRSGLITRLRAWPLERSIGTDSKFKPDLMTGGKGEDDDG